MSEFDEGSGSMHDEYYVGVRQLLMETGMKADSLEEEEPLLRALRYGMYERAALLINNKCDINLKDRYGRTPVMLAARYGRKDIVDLLLHRGAQLNCIDDDGWTLLHQVSCNGWTDIGRLILDNGGADLNAVDICGNTALMWAVLKGHEELAALLIQAGTDVNIRDGFNKTVLLVAAERGRSRVIQILLEEGLDLNHEDISGGDTPLHLACLNYYYYRDSRQTDCPEAVKQLLHAGADTNVKNELGQTPLNIGFRGSGITHKEIGLFVQKGAFLESCDYERISRPRNTYLKENVLKDVELCTQSVVNKFNRQSLPALNSIAYFARRLPNVDNFKLGARHIDEVKNLVKCEIERNTFCNVVKIRPIALSALCVQSLITCQSGKKRAASTVFGISPLKKNHN